jgi:transcriptional regulatory protein LevR
MVIDHHHKKKRVRKVICTSCNTGIGYFREDVKAMARAIDHLKEHE